MSNQPQYPAAPGTPSYAGFQPQGGPPPPSAPAGGYAGPSQYQQDPDYSDPDAVARESGGVRHHVFKDNLRVRLPGRGDDDKTYLHVMPEFGDIQDPKSWYWYRFWNNQTQTWQFTQWMRGYFVWEYVGGRCSIISPKSYPNGAGVSFDPVEVMYEKCRSNPAFYRIIGLGPDRKKIEGKDAVKERKLQFRAKRYVMNAVNPTKRAEGEDNMSCLYSLPSTSIYGGGGDESGANVGSNWGLAAALDMKARLDPNAPPPQAYEFDKMFYWGDITRPDRNVPIVVFKSAPPTGGRAIKLYNAQPLDQGALVVPEQWLTTRVPLRPTHLFVDYNTADVIEKLETLFCSISPDLLLASFDGLVMGYREKFNAKFGAGVPGTHGGHSYPSAAIPGGQPPGMPGGFVPGGAPPGVPGGYTGYPGHAAPFTPPAAQQPASPPQYAPPGYTPPSAPPPVATPPAGAPPGFTPPPAGAPGGYPMPGGAVPGTPPPPANVPVPTAPPPSYGPPGATNAPGPTGYTPPPAGAPTGAPPPAAGQPVTPGIGQGAAVSADDIQRMIDQGRQQAQPPSQ